MNEKGEIKGILAEGREKSKKTTGDKHDLFHPKVWVLSLGRG